MDFSWCLTHLSIILYFLISCRPSPCAKLSSARTTMTAPLPCRIFSGFPHSPSGHFGLGNLRLDLFEYSLLWYRSGVFVLYTFIMVGRCGYIAMRKEIILIATAHGFSIILRRWLAYATLDCPLSNSAFILIHNFSSCRSVVGRWFPQLTTFPICYTPLWVSPPDKLGDDGAELSPMIPLHRCPAIDRIHYKSILIYISTLRTHFLSQK